MNERIKELAEQAGLISAEYNGFDSMNLTKAQINFAKLLLRECINEVHVADVGDLESKGYYLDKVAEHLEKHFGVEE